MKYDANTPILFIILELNDITISTLKQIAEISPKRFYYSMLGDISQKSIESKINWECHREMLFRSSKEENVLEVAGISISNFFELEKEGIIVHSNCVLNNDFWGFCSTLLKRYRYDRRISQICGTNVQNGIIGNADYYYSNLTQVFAFASWRRAWQGTNEVFQKANEIQNGYKSESYSKFEYLWEQPFNVARSLSPKIWNLNFTYNNIINHRLSVIPNKNLVSGINICQYPFRKEINESKTKGFRKKQLVHPRTMIPNVQADIQTQLFEFGIVKSTIEVDPVLFLEKRIKSIEENNVGIPKIVHQIYICENQESCIPNHLLELSKSWRKYLPNWEYHFWDKESVETFLQEKCPHYIALYKSLPYDVQRWDMIRYLILYYIGGMYVDMDYECLEPIESILSEGELFLGLEPQENAMINRKDAIVGNALMASVPHHPFMKCVIDNIKKNGCKSIPNKSLQIMETTGPFMLTRMYEEFPDKDEITLLPAELVAPLCISEVQDLLQGKTNEEMERKVERAYAIHYFGSSWHSQITE